MLTLVAYLSRGRGSKLFGLGAFVLRVLMLASLASVVRINSAIDHIASGILSRVAVLVRPSCPDNSVANIRDHTPVTRTSLQGRRSLESTRRLRRYRSVTIKEAFDQISKYMASE